MRNPKKSKSFTLIEVIISIIILGIIFSTMSMMMTAFTTSLKTNVKEQVFFSQFSLLSLITSKYFDENNTVGDNYYKDLNTTSNADDELIIRQYSSNELNRIGKHQISSGVRTLTSLEFRTGSSSMVSATLGCDADEKDANGECNETKFDDIDDYNGFGEHIEGVEGGFDINVTVSYIPDDTNYSDVNITFTYDDGTTTSGTNIKMIKIYTRLKDGTIMTLRYPACNIGGSSMLSYK